MKTFFQQGDVILIPTTKIPKGFEPAKTDVVQEGEFTGHAHRLHGHDYQVFAPPGPVTNDTKKFLRVVKPTMLKHEEHKEIALPPGDFEIRIVREYDHFAEEARRVAD